MPIPKSSDEANTIDGPKVFTKEMVRDLSIGELGRLMKQGWDFADPIEGKTWQEIFNQGADKDGYHYKAPDFHEGMLLENQVPEGDTYIAGTIGKIPKRRN